MKSIERVKKAINGEKTDHTPNFSIMIAAACELCGVNQRDYYLDSELMADTLIKARELCGGDGIYVSKDNWVYHQALGGLIELPDNNESFSKQHVLTSIDDYKKLSIPDPENAPGMKTVLDAARKVVEKTKGEYYIQANTDCGPYSMAGVLLGEQNLMMAMYTEEEKTITDFLKFCEEVVIAYNKAMQKTGVHGIQYGDSTCSLVNTEMYNRFIYPSQKRTLEALKNPYCDRWLHICGNSEHILDGVAQLEMEGFEVDALVPIEKARKILGDDIALKGNIDTTYIWQKSPEEVYHETQRIIKNNGLESKLIFSSGCGVPKKTPLDNLQAITRACREY